MDTKSFKVSVIIPNWNGRNLIEKCLNSIFQQTYQNFEVIVIDSASEDNSVNFIKENYPQVNLIQLFKDKGPTYALNEGIKIATGDIFLFLNNDVFLKKDTMEILVKEILMDKNAVISPIELDWEGNFRRAGGPFYLPGMFLLKPFFKPIKEPFHPLMACCMCFAEIIKENPLNTNLIMYEELEWAWRLHLKKIKVKIIPNAYYFHKIEATKKRGSPQQIFLYSRLMVAQCYICFKSLSLILLSPFLFLYYLKLLAFAFYSFRLKSVSFVFRGLLDFKNNRKIFMQNREHIQKERLIGDKEIIKRMLGSYQFKKESIKKFKNLKINLDVESI